MASIPWKQILDYLGEVGAERDLDSLLWRSIVALDKIVPFDSGALHMTNSAHDILPSSRMFRAPRKALEDYIDYYAKLDPSRDNLPPDAGATAASWVRDVGHIELVDDFLLPNNVRSSAGMCLYDAAGRLCAFVNICRSSAKGFREAEVATLELLHTHVSNLVAGYTAEGALDSYTPAELQDTCRLLSRRELEVARLTCKRLTAAQTGTILRISPRTVEQYLENIYDKLGVHGKEELARALLRGRRPEERSRPYAR